MCIILDANKYGDFLNPKNKDMLPIKNWIDNKGGKIAYSPTKKFKDELNNVKNMRQLFNTYIERGRIKFIDKEKVKYKEDQLSGLVSDDPHIIALAQVANVKLLVSGDRKLHTDFKNNKFITNGKVYQTKRHSNLLSQSSCP